MRSIRSLNVFWPCLGFSAGVLAQAPFARQLGTGSVINTSAFTSTEMANGDIVSVHQSFILQPAERPLHFKRFDANGVLLNAVDHAHAIDPALTNFHVEKIVELPNGDVAACASGNRAVFIRFSAEGELLVVNMFQSAFGGYAGLYDMRLLSTTELVVNGLITNGPAQDESFFARLDLDGNILESWSDRFAGLRGAGRKVVLTQDQGMLMGGENYTTVGYTDPRAYVQKLNAAGQVQWVRSFTNLESDLEDLVELPGGASLALLLFFPNGSNYSPALVKFSATGEVVHAQHVGTDAAFMNNWQSYHLEPMNDTTLLISGDDSGAGHFLARADTNGVIDLVATRIPHGVSGVCRRSQPLLLDNGDLLLTGYRGTSPGYEMVVCRVPVGGPLPCDTGAYSLFSEELSPSFDNTVSRSNPAVVTTDISSLFSPASWTWTATALCPTTAQNEGAPLPGGLRLFPNPATSTVRLEVPDGMRALHVLDATGACVWTWNAPLPQVLSLHELPAGMYAVRCSDGTSAHTRRLAVQR